MILTIQVISSHPLLTREVGRMLSGAVEFSVLPAAANESETMGSDDGPKLFLLDACSLQTDLASLVRRCRARSPGSKFLVLLSPDDDSMEKIRLFYCGIDGFVELGEGWQAELPLAIASIMKDQPWVPAEILMVYVKQAKALLERQLLPATHLTVREEQVLHLLMRSLSNREIANTLTISERTVKFHVSNILAKLGASDRTDLSPEHLVGTTPRERNAQAAGEEDARNWRDAAAARR